MVSMYPDEFKEDILNTLEGFKARFYEILHRTSDYFMQISHLTNRREFAEEAKKFMWPNLLFATLDKRDVASMIYDIIEREI